MITALGLCSGALTTISFLPQVLRAIRTGSSSDLSWSWLILLGLGVCGWVSYGLLTTDISIIMANAATAALVFVLLAVKARHTGLRRSL
jgi:MtN3 and saliva related transmembrane protein